MIRANNPDDKGVDLPRMRRRIEGSVPTGVDAVGASGRWLRSDKPLSKTPGAAQGPHLARML
jgi:hypothetical protein